MMSDMHWRLASEERIIGFDILRGIVTLAVFLLHFFMSIPQGFSFQVEGITWRIVYWGNCLLECFFALSGFLIGGRLLESKTWDRSILFDYTIDRATRILPAYTAVFIVMTFISIVFWGKRTIEYAYILFLQCYTGNLYFIGVAWTLSIEVFSYIILPVFIYIFKFRVMVFKNYYDNIIFFSLLIIGGETLLRGLVMLCLPDTLMDDGIRKQLHLRLDALFYGLIIFCLKSKGVLYARLASLTVCLLAVGGMVAISEWQYADYFIRNTPAENNKVWHALVDFTASGILAAAVLPFFGSIQRLNIRSAVIQYAGNFFIYLAKISYSFYLIHLILLGWFCHLFYKTEFSNPFFNFLYYSVLMLIYVVACFLCADKMYLYIEKPGMRLRKGLKKLRSR